MWITAIRFLIANWKYVIGFGVLIACFTTGYHYGASGVQRKWDKETAANVAAQLALAQKNAKTIHDLEEDRNANQATIDTLVTRNIGLHLRNTACTKTPSPSDQATAGDGALHSDPSAIVEGYSIEVGRLFKQCDEVVEDARVMRKYLDSL